MILLCLFVRQGKQFNFLLRIQALGVQKVWCNEICSKILKDEYLEWQVPLSFQTRWQGPLWFHCTGETKTEVAHTFCYVGETHNAGGGCKHVAIARAKSAWGKFRELLPFLTKLYIYIKTCAKIFHTCLQSCSMVLKAGHTERRIEYDLEEMTRHCWDGFVMWNFTSIWE